MTAGAPQRPTEPFDDPLEPEELGTEAVPESDDAFDEEGDEEPGRGFVPAVPIFSLHASWQLMHAEVSTNVP